MWAAINTTPFLTFGNSSMGIAISWFAAILLAVLAIVAYTMLINRAFLRCPHCEKIGSWRFDDLDEPIEEFDDDECLIRSATRQKCRKCGGEVIHIWSDYEGRAIKLPEESP